MAIAIKPAKVLAKLFAISWIEFRKYSRVSVGDRAVDNATGHKRALLRDRLQLLLRKTLQRRDIGFRSVGRRSLHGADQRLGVESGHENSLSFEEGFVGDGLAEKGRSLILERP